MGGPDASPSPGKPIYGTFRPQTAPARGHFQNERNVVGAADMRTRNPLRSSRTFDTLRRHGLQLALGWTRTRSTLLQ